MSRTIPTVLSLVLLLPMSAASQSSEFSVDPASSPQAEDPAAAVPEVDPKQEPFRPLEPQPDDFDWIRLKSGEWLKGELLRLRDGTLEFDSDELDELKLDWDDIVEVRCPRMCTVLLEGKVVKQGTLHVKDGAVVLEGGDGQELELERDQVMAVIPGDPSEGNYWSGKVSLGLTGRRGNTSQSDYTSYIFLRRETVATRWDTTYNGAYSKTQGIEVANNHRVNSRFDYFVTKRLFLTPASVTALRDPFANIDLRLTPSLGFGYDLLDMNTISWDVGGGPAYQYERYDSVAPGEPTTSESFAGLLATGVDWDITPDVETKLTYQIIAPIPDTDEYNHHLSWILSLDLISSIDLDVTFVWDRVNKPREGSDGVTPVPDDFRLSVGFGFDF